VDGLGGDFPRAHGLNDRSGAGDGVASREHARPVVAIVSSVTMQPCLVASRPSVADRISGLGDVPSAKDDAVRLQNEIGVFDRDRAGSGRTRPFAELHLHALNRVHAALLVPRILTGLLSIWNSMPSSMA
jgi:hypothetical protein